MCRENFSSGAAAISDEVWDEAAVSESDTSDVESEPGCAPRSTAQQQQHAVGRVALKPQVVPARQPPARQTYLAPQKLGAQGSPAVMPVPPVGSLMKLVTHLRGDNTRLHDALTQAQRSLEILADNQAAREASSQVDFAHLLALVKDFGEDLGEFEYHEQDEPGHACQDLQVFAISSPRGVENVGAPCEVIEESPEDEVQRLKMELQRAHHEIGDLKVELATKDDELAQLRGSYAFDEDDEEDDV
jgi:hypothetical protein